MTYWVPGCLLVQDGDQPGVVGVHQRLLDAERSRAFPGPVCSPELTQIRPSGIVASTPAANAPVSVRPDWG